MPLPQITESLIHQYTDPKTFNRGKEYFEEGAVVSLTIRGDVLQAEVEGSVDIFLHEKLIDDAQAAIKGSGDYDLIGKVVDAAIGERPETAIRISRLQANTIMDGEKSQYYSNAIRWLQRAKAAYLATNQKAEWQSYLDELLVSHKQKHKLMPMLRTL